MPRPPPPGFFVLTAVVLFLWYVVWTRNHERPISNLAHIGVPIWKQSHHAEPPPEIHVGEVIMGKLGNETLKAELGRAAWKLFHTTMARFPDNPTEDQSKALKDYIHLFARLYPCGECAEHFQQILKKYPPQTSSRSTAAAWACLVHNEVNISKQKPIFDCANIGDWYDCGCADDGKETTSNTDSKSDKTAAGHEPVEILREGPTNGG